MHKGHSLQVKDDGSGNCDVVAIRGEVYVDAKCALGGIFVVVREEVEVGGAVEVVAAAPVHGEVSWLECDAHGVHVELRSLGCLLLLLLLFTFAHRILHHALVLCSTILRQNPLKRPPRAAARRERQLPLAPPLHVVAAACGGNVERSCGVIGPGVGGEGWGGNGGFAVEKISLGGGVWNLVVLIVKTK